MLIYPCINGDWSDYGVQSCELGPHTDYTVYKGRAVLLYQLQELCIFKPMASTSSSKKLSILKFTTLQKCSVSSFPFSKHIFVLKKMKFVGEKVVLWNTILCLAFF